MALGSRLTDLPSSLDVATAVGEASAEIQKLFAGFVAQPPSAEMNALDPLGVLPAFSTFITELAHHPERVIEAQMALWQAYQTIWTQTAARAWGMERTVQEPTAPGDRRFKAKDWDSNPFFDYLRQTYLATGGALQDLVAGTGSLDDKTSRKVAFYMQQFIDALSPTNFAATNPDVLHATVRTGGRNLVDGLTNFLNDIDPKSGRLRTRMVNSQAFELGVNVATTSGSVVFQNELMQIIQYRPATESVRERPLLIIPPWINKYYVLDLQPANSFIKWAVEQGLTVFIVSWVNPDESLADKDFDDYVLSGALTAIDAVQRATGQTSVNAIGYCLGGTLLGATLALMSARGDDRIHAATFFTAMLDFEEPGDLGVFIDEQQLEMIEEMMSEKGYLDGSEMATTFNMLRANDLIWSFVINNYLLGRQPADFDLLYWNSDSTRMPARMHSTYLRKMYLENVFSKPGGMSIDGTPIDLTAIDTPACFIAAIEDHIAPWKSTYTGAALLRGETTFILSQAGHIAGIVNPPGDRAYGHYIGQPPQESDPDAWLESAEHRAQSWWPGWAEWIHAQSGEWVAAREPGSGDLPVIEAAPGSYVRLRIT